MGISFLNELFITFHMTISGFNHSASIVPENS
jgi:hypothetical protein